VVLDLRTVADAEEQDLAEALRRAATGGARQA
jgi:hypothetical protein